MEFTSIILAIIWRLAPSLWLEWAIRRLVHWAIAVLNHEQDWLDERPRNSHWFGGWLAVIEARIEELINLRAHQLLNRRCDPREVPSHHPAPAVRSLDDCVIRLARLVQRLEDVDRLARCRARALLRLADVTVIELMPDHRPAEAAPSAASCAVAASRIRSSSVENGSPARYYDPLIRGPPWLYF